jgi:ADP-ribose pyrophosphatase YjhB (NUDIX family)
MAEPCIANPRWPRSGASAAIFRGRDVLLIQRGEGALQGLWSLPGGHIEPGELAHAAALREVQEETAVEAALEGLLDIHEVMRHDESGNILAHYILLVFFGRWLSGEPVARSDAAAARFVPIEALDALPMTDGAAGFIQQAWDRLAENGTR